MRVPKDDQTEAEKAIYREGCSDEPKEQEEWTVFDRWVGITILLIFWIIVLYFVGR